MHAPCAFACTCHEAGHRRDNLSGRAHYARSHVHQTTCAARTDSKRSIQRQSRVALQQAAHASIPQLQRHRDAAAPPKGLGVVPHGRPEVHGGLERDAEGIERCGGKCGSACRHKHCHACLQQARTGVCMPGCANVSLQPLLWAARRAGLSACGRPRVALGSRAMQVPRSLLVGARLVTIASRHDTYGDVLAQMTQRIAGRCSAHSLPPKPSSASRPRARVLR